MFSLLVLAYVLNSTVFESTIDRAFTAFQNNDWAAAAAALDQASLADPAVFRANNFHYLRGRVAENQGDWIRARNEFIKIENGNPLYGLASWRAARASVRLRDDQAAEGFFDLLPKTFPADLKTQIAFEAGDALASKIYRDLSTRDARFRRAKIDWDTAAFWSLIREDKDDDAALEAARSLQPTARTASERMQLAETFAAHREFDQALPLYQSASEDPLYAAEARYLIGRAYFLAEDYRTALQWYQGVAKDFAGTEWEEEAEYQMASCYWRLAEYREAEKAYLNYIRKYGSKGSEEGATRNLVDVYRMLGENSKALALIDRTLARRVSVPTRQVLLFSKAKILYSENKLTAALPIFQQLGRMRLRSAAGGTTADEVQYFQAICLARTGKKAAAEAIWQKLARDEFSYYGQRSAEKLGRRSALASRSGCFAEPAAITRRVEEDLLTLRRPLAPERDPEANMVSELMFLRLWDEASLWSEYAGQRTQTRTAAQLAYMAGRYNRTISYAGRLPKTVSNLHLLYPAGFHQLICKAATAYSADPLWLHAIIWQESKYNANARSGAAARGLMQFIPQTAKTVGAAIGLSNLTVDKLYDPSLNIQLGAHHWSSLLEKLKVPEMALAAYNGGLDNVLRWKGKSGGNDVELFVADIGFIETKRYVMSVFAARAAYGSQMR